MSTSVNILSGLGIPSQIPLNPKQNSASEAALKDLGLNNNLAFTYEQGLIVYCRLEGTRYEWREVESGEELTGLRDTDFIYPDGTITDDVDYSNKKYNFFPVITNATPSEVYIEQGDNITITGTGSEFDPLIINGLDSPFTKINEGNGEGVIIRDRISTNYGNVGLNAVDLSYSQGSSSTRGATGNNSFAVGLSVTASGQASGAIGGDNISSGQTSFTAGYNNLGSHESTISLGRDNQSIYDNAISIGRNNISSGLGALSLGTNLTSKSIYETVIGSNNTNYTPIGGILSWNSNDRLFTIGNGFNEFNKSDALLIYKNGLALLPSVTNSLIENATGKAIVTREYLESILPSTVDGSETKLTAGTNITITGNGTILTPYNISYDADDISQYTDEMARDAVGTILQNTSTINFNYDDVLESITADVNINASSTSTGILQGGVLSIGSLPTLWTIQAGEGYIYNSLLNTTKKITWVTQSDLVATYLTTNISTYVLIDDLGGIVQQTTSPTQSQLRTHIYIGKLAHTTLTSILFTVTEPSRMFDIAGQIGDLNSAIGPINVGGGNVINHNGSNLTISATAGGTYRPGSNYSANRNSPSITSEPQVLAPTFRRKYRNGTGGWIAVNSTTIDPDRYDNNSGTLVTVPTGKFTVQVLWRFGGTGTIHVDYGQTYYDTLEQARASIGGSVVVQDPDNVRDAVKRGWLVVKQNTNVLNNSTDAVFIQADKFGERGATGAIPSLQTTYNNSTTPEIETNSSLGAFSIKRGSASDSDNVFEIINGSGVITSAIKGDGSLTATLYNGYIPENNTNKVLDFNTVNNTVYPSVQAVKTYVDGLVVGLLDDRGSWDASSNLFPTTGGSGLSNTVVKGDFWYVSVAGSLGGQVVNVGDSFRALTDIPGQTLSNWSILEGNLGYVPENIVNKSDSYTASSSTTYASTKAVVDGLATKVNSSSFTTTPTASAFTHYFGETVSDGIIRPKTLANVKTEIVTTAAVDAAKANIVTGTGVNTYIARFTGTNTIEGNTIMQDLSTTGNGLKYVFPTASTNKFILNKGGVSGLEINIAAPSLIDSGVGDNVNIFSLMGGLTEGTESYGGIKVLTSTNALSSKLCFYTGAYTGSPTLRGTVTTDGKWLFGTSANDGVNSGQFVGGLKADVLRISTTPTTSAGTYKLLTYNETSDEVESVASTTYATTTSPAFTGTPTAPTATVGTNTTQIATTAFVLENTKQEVLSYACSDETSNLTVGTLVTFRMPFGFTLTSVRASVNTAPTVSSIIVDVKESGASIFSTLLSIDATEKTSVTAATPAVISDSSLADDAEITISTTQIGSGVAGAGLKITLIGTRT